MLENQLFQFLEDSPLNNLDTFKITIEDGCRGDWRKYSLGDSISKNSSFDQSLLTFSISDDNDGSLMKIIYDAPNKVYFYCNQYLKNK